MRILKVQKEPRAAGVLSFAAGRLKYNLIIAESGEIGNKVLLELRFFEGIRL